MKCNGMSSAANVFFSTRHREAISGMNAKLSAITRGKDDVPLVSFDVYYGTDKPAWEKALEDVHGLVVEGEKQDADGSTRPPPRMYFKRGGLVWCKMDWKMMIWGLAFENIPPEWNMARFAWGQEAINQLERRTHGQTH